MDIIFSMPYLIDGHNLIPKLGLSLAALEDEQQLLALLNEFARLTRRGGLEVYFDGAPGPQAGTRRAGMVTAHFVRRGQIADDAIRQRLRQLGAASRNWIVVSSDRMVQAAAREAHAQALSSEEFAGQVLQARQRPAASADAADQAALPPDEVQAWLELFRQGKPKL